MKHGRSCTAGSERDVVGGKERAAVGGRVREAADPICRQGEVIDYLRMTFEWACDGLAVERVRDLCRVA